MTFGYKGLQLNLLDTPGHQDFSEDTYRWVTRVTLGVTLTFISNRGDTAVW